MTQRIAEAIELAAGHRVIPDEIARRPYDFLDPISRMLSFDAPIRRTEDLEWAFKATLWSAMSRGVDIEQARRIARVQARLGFVMKYKSYAIKAASPLGYSVFFQEPGEGFSIQLHEDHKVEIFNILDVSPGAFVLLADREEWESLAGSAAVHRLLATGDISGLEHVAHVPRPGDVVVVHEPGIVHSVFGCVLEEFATASTDMVLRLHDQNEGRSIPDHFDRARASTRLTRLSVPRGARKVRREGNRWTDERLQWERVGSRIELGVGSVGDMTATRIELDWGMNSRMAPSARATSLFVLGGHGTLGLPTVADDPSPLPLAPGTLTTIPPDTPYEIRAFERDYLSISVHQVPLEDAFSEQIHSSLPYGAAVDSLTAA